MLRKRLHKLGVYKGVKVVFSSEFTDPEAIVLAESRNKKSNVGTISYMPAYLRVLYRFGSGPRSHWRE